jgi:hypothetical protein
MDKYSYREIYYKNASCVLIGWSTSYREIPLWGFQLFSNWSVYLYRNFTCVLIGESTNCREISYRRKTYSKLPPPPSTVSLVTGGGKMVPDTTWGRNFKKKLKFVIFWSAQSPKSFFLIKILFDEFWSFSTSFCLFTKFF